MSSTTFWRTRQVKIRQIPFGGLLTFPAILLYVQVSNEGCGGIWCFERRPLLQS